MLRLSAGLQRLSGSEFQVMLMLGDWSGIWSVKSTVTTVEYL